MPVRVTQAIRKQQDASERLIGWFQLAVVVLFGTLYAVSPKTFSDAATFQPVPWALGLYLGFTVLRIGAAHRGWAPAWLLYLSIIADMALLFGLIWSFHLQYQQPPTFYLKAPTLLYVFIFIALRALRFEARYVIAAGLVAAAGWTVLAIYAAIGTGGAEMITRDYVKYMTTNAILIGAEADKIISILTVTAIIAVAISRARALLERAVREGAAAHDLARFFSPEIARQITAAEQQVHAGEGVAREAAILLCDIRGFTRLAADIPPDAVMALLAEYQARLVPIIQSHGGAIDKFMGDGILATFGAAVSSERFAADACRTVDAVMDAVESWNAARVKTGALPLRIGAAIATGRVVFGAVGDESRLEYTVIGDAVNLSAKLENHNKAENVRALASADAYALARAQGYVRASPPRPINGAVIEGLARPCDIVVLAE